MELKQRLIGLLKTATCEEVLTNSDGEVIDSHLTRMVNVDVVELLADHLIANGVTIRERGEWKPFDVIHEDDGDWAMFACSLCEHPTTSYYQDERDISRFCPHCGADMRGGKDE